jgi:acetyl-CoA carboxylase biotin carboxyl carrier protein
MTELNNGGPTAVAAGADTGEPSVGEPGAGEPTVEVLRQTALSLLASLPQRPERLRVQAADTAIDLDWRTPSPGPAVVASLNGHGPSAAAGPVIAGQAPGQAVAAGAAEGAPPAEEQRSDLHFVRAPSVGTFYRAPKPGAEPFVTEGSVVSAGQQVGIVEAMKLMLPVEASRAGEVVQVLAVDGQAVEYDEQLIVLAPAT